MMQAPRPKRGAAQRANYVINYITLNYKEEQDLRKAIQASLSDAKTSRKSNISSSSQSGANCSVTNESKKLDEKGAKSNNKNNNPIHASGSIVSPVLASVVKKRPLSPKPSKELTESTSNATSNSTGIEKKKPKIPSQRKFAQNSNSLGSSTNTTPVKFGPFTPLIPTNEIFPAIKPATEDFLTFLCLRKTSLLPRKLNMFALNEEAMKGKKIEKPFTPKIIQTPTKQEAVQSTSSSSSSSYSNNAKSRPKYNESKNLLPPTSYPKSTTVKSEEKPVKNQSSTKPATKNNSIKATGKSEVNSKKSSSTTSSSTCNVKTSNKSIVNSVSSSKEKKYPQSTTSNKCQASSSSTSSSALKSLTTLQPQKRITRSTSGINDDSSLNVKSSRSANKQQSSSKCKGKPKATNVAAAKILKNAVTSKKKANQAHISTPRGFVLDRVTRSIKHLRSMEEASKSKSGHKN